MDRDAVVSQNLVWSWGQNLLKASLNTPLDNDVDKSKYFLQHNQVINKDVTCGVSIFKFNSEGLAEFTSENYSDAIKMTQFSDCFILERED